MEIGYKITKPVETQEQCDSYAEVAKWCNDNNAHIEDKGEWYEVVENEPVEVEVDTTPTQEERLSAVEDAISELAEIIVSMAEETEAEQ